MLEAHLSPCINFGNWSVLYESANDPRTANDPGPQMIPKLDRK